MRILLVNYEYPPLGGGGGVLTKTLATELARRHSVTVLTTRASGLPAESFDDGVHIVRVGVLGRKEMERASMTSLLSFVPSARREGARLLRGATFDVVHSIFAVPSGSAGGPLARRAAAPHVLTVIGGDIFDPSRRISADRFPPLRAAVGRVVRGARAVTAISQDVARRAEEITGRTGILVVPCAVETPRLPAADRASLGWRRDDVVVLTIARLVARKGLDTLIAAVGRAGGPLRLEVVGDGPERPRLEAHAASVAPGRVSFAGTAEPGAKALRLASADAFALVSLHEGFGLVYLEAMHAGLPVVAGTAGGQIDYLRDGANALLVPPGDVTALSEALRRIAGDPALRRALAADARRTAGAYTPERMASQYTHIYEHEAG